MNVWGIVASSVISLVIAIIGFFNTGIRLEEFKSEMKTIQENRGIEKEKTFEIYGKFMVISLFIQDERFGRSVEDSEMAYNKATEFELDLSNNDIYLHGNIKTRFQNQLKLYFNVCVYHESIDEYRQDYREYEIGLAVLKQAIRNRFNMDD